LLFSIGQEFLSVFLFDIGDVWLNRIRHMVERLLLDIIIGRLLQRLDFVRLAKCLGVNKEPLQLINPIYPVGEAFCRLVQAVLGVL